MKYQLKKSWSLFVIAACFVPETLGETVSMKLTAPPPGPVLAGVYISPYKAMIGPANTNPLNTGVLTEIICDDFATEVSLNTNAWQANVVNVASLQGQTTANQSLKFGKNETGANQAEDYTVAAYLAVEIMTAKQQGDIAKQGALSFALWGLFDTEPLSGQWITGSTLATAQSYLQAARNAVAAGLTAANFANVSIYTAVPETASQEFLVVSMPEPGSLALLGLDLTLIVGLVMLVKRRAARAA